MDSVNPVIHAAERSDGERILELYAEMDRVHRERHPELYQSANAVIRDLASVEALLSLPHSETLVAETREGGQRR